MKKNNFFVLLFALSVFMGTRFIEPVNANIPIPKSEPTVVYLPATADPKNKLKEIENLVEKEPEKTIQYVRTEVIKERFLTKEVPVYVEVPANPKISEKALEILAPVKMAGISKSVCPHLN